MRLQPELVPYEAIRKELQAQDKLKRRMPDPDRPYGTPKAWVVYMWSHRRQAWMPRGFSKAQRITTKTLERIRRRFKVKEPYTMLVVDLLTVEKFGPPVMPPKIVLPSAVIRSAKPVVRKPRVIRRKSTLPPFTKETRYVALGRWVAPKLPKPDPKKKKTKPSIVESARARRPREWPLYLGPVAATVRKKAKREAEQLWPMYEVTLVVAQHLPYRVRRSLKNGRIDPGFTRFDPVFLTWRKRKRA